MKLLTFAIIFLTGCAQLSNSSDTTQPVTVKDPGKNIMVTTCSGVVEDWGSCQNKARKTCPNGYEVLEKIESPVGGKRELTFQCK
jgi:hypothetical protein